MAENQLEAPKDEGKKKGGKLKWIILLVILLGVLGGGGWFGYKYFFAKKAETTEGAPADADADAKKEEGKGDKTKTEIVTLPTFVVNLADPLGRRYLKLTVDVEMTDQKAAEELRGAEPKVRDAIILLLSSKTFADLSSVESKILLKNEIVERLNQVVGGSKVLRVYFTELVIQ
ncbi:MAG: flagellar basal body-associated FliL family protein [Thermodesulfobacteriota bacterium]